MAVYLAPTGSGIGDVIVCRPVFDWLLRQSADPVYLVVRGPRQVGLSLLLPGVAGEVREPELAEQLRRGDRYINLRDHRLQRNENWFSNQFKLKFPGLNITGILTTICRDLGIDADCREIRPLAFRRDERMSGKVALIPGTTMKAKMLHSKVWQNLHCALSERHIDSVVLGMPTRSPEVQELIDAQLPYYDTSNLQQAINLVSSAAAVVSVDTGLMHLAVQQGVPTAVIFGMCEAYYRPAPNCTAIYAAAPAVATDSNSEASDHNFSATYDNWNWFPDDAQSGDCLDFADVDRLLTLVVQLLGKTKNN